MPFKLRASSYRDLYVHIHVVLRSKYHLKLLIHTLLRYNDLTNRFIDFNAANVDVVPPGRLELPQPKINRF